MVLLREEQQGDVPDFSEDKRHYPIFVPTNSLIISRNTYHIPDSLKINFIPPDYNLETGFMQVSTKYTKGDGTITVESIYHLKRAFIPVQGYADVKKFRDELNKKYELYIVLKKKSNLAPEAESWIKETNRTMKSFWNDKEAKKFQARPAGIACLYFPFIRTGYELGHAWRGQYIGQGPCPGFFWHRTRSALYQRQRLGLSDDRSLRVLRR